MIVNLQKDFARLASDPPGDASRADIIMVTRGIDQEARKTAKEALDSLRSSEAEGTFRVIVVEREPSCPDYPQADLMLRASSEDSIQRIYNEAIGHTRLPFVVLCHPDVVFHRGWWTQLRGAMQSHLLVSASPRCPDKQPIVSSDVNRMHLTTAVDKIVLGHETELLVCGWCLALRRSALRSLFPLSEQEQFFSHVHEISHRLAAARLRHGLVGVSTVTHRGDKPHYIEVKQDNPLEGWPPRADDAAAPQVTLIATAFKRFHTLLGLICAMNTQTRPDWKMHIVSDGDDPDLESKISPYLSEKIRWSHVAQPDGKPIGDWGFTASNHALRECDTPYVVFTSDDNYYVPTFVENMLGAAEKYRLDFVYCKTLHNYERYIYERFCDNELVRGRMDKGQFMVKTELVRKAGGIVGGYPWADGAMIERIVTQNPDMRVMKLESCLYIHN